MVSDLQRILAFLAAFARRQAARTIEIPGGAVVLNPNFAFSHEHNGIVVDGTPPGDLTTPAEQYLAHLKYRRIEVLDASVAATHAPALTAAGYTQAVETVMLYTGPPRDADPRVQIVDPAEIRDADIAQTRAWIPEASHSELAQMADRRSARLQGAATVRFLAVRDDRGETAAWSDLYLDPGIAQLEALVTATPHTRRGYADAILTTAIHMTATTDLFFLLADPTDWPQTWYTRRGFTPIGAIHVFTRTP